MSEQENKKVKVGLVSLILSVLAAALGVQKRKNLEKDFSQSNPFPYIIAGVIFTLVFIIVLMSIVKIVIAK